MPFIDCDSGSDVSSGRTLRRNVPEIEWKQRSHVYEFMELKRSRSLFHGVHVWIGLEVGVWKGVRGGSVCMPQLPAQTVEVATLFCSQRRNERQERPKLKSASFNTNPPCFFPDDAGSRILQSWSPAIPEDALCGMPIGDTIPSSGKLKEFRPAPVAMLAGLPFLPRSRRICCCATRWYVEAT